MSTKNFPTRKDNRATVTAGHEGKRQGLARQAVKDNRRSNTKSAVRHNLKNWSN